MRDDPLRLDKDRQTMSVADDAVPSIAKEIPREVFARVAEEHYDELLEHTKAGRRSVAYVSVRLETDGERSYASRLTTAKPDGTVDVERGDQYRQGMLELWETPLNVNAPALCISLELVDVATSKRMYTSTRLVLDKKGK